MFERNWFFLRAMSVISLASNCNNIGSSLFTYKWTYGSCCLRVSDGHRALLENRPIIWSSSSVPENFDATERLPCSLFVVPVTPQ